MNLETMLVFNEPLKKLKFNSNLKNQSQTQTTPKTEMERKQQLTEETTSVSNKDALKDKIHEIHNYMRNNGVGYGMGAFKVFNLLYGLKKFEECGLLDKINLARPVCEFSYLLGLATLVKMKNWSMLFLEMFWTRLIRAMFETYFSMKFLVILKDLH